MGTHKVGCVTFLIMPSNSIHSTLCSTLHMSGNGIHLMMEMLYGSASSFSMILTRIYWTVTGDTDEWLSGLADCLEISLVQTGVPCLLLSSRSDLVSVATFHWFPCPWHPAPVDREWLHLCHESVCTRPAHTMLTHRLQCFLLPSALTVWTRNIHVWCWLWGQSTHRTSVSQHQKSLLAHQETQTERRFFSASGPIE